MGTPSQPSTRTLVLLALLLLVLIVAWLMATAPENPSMGEGPTVQTTGATR